MGVGKAIAVLQRTPIPSLQTSALNISCFLDPNIRVTSETPKFQPKPLKLADLVLQRSPPISLQNPSSNNKDPYSHVWIPDITTKIPKVPPEALSNPGKPLISSRGHRPHQLDPGFSPQQPGVRGQRPRSRVRGQAGWDRYLTPALPGAPRPAQPPPTVGQELVPPPS